MSAIYRGDFYKSVVFPSGRLSIDKLWFARGGSVAIVSIAFSQIAQAVLMLVYPRSAPFATSLLAITKSLKAMGAPDGSTFVAWVMIAASIIVLFAAIFKLGYIRLLLFMSQQILLTFMLGGAILATIHGVYLDGTVLPEPHPAAHIGADQICLLAPLWFIHVTAILRRAWDPNG